MLGKPGFHLLRCGTAAKKLFECVEVDRKIPIPAFRAGQNLVIDRMPFGELRKVFPDSWGVGAEVMGAVRMDQDACGIIAVIGIPSNVVALFNQQTSLTKFCREAFGHGEAGETGTDDEGAHGKLAVGKRLVFSRNPEKNSFFCSGG